MHYISNFRERDLSISKAVSRHSIESSSRHIDKYYHQISA